MQVAREQRPVDEADDVPERGAQRDREDGEAALPRLLEQRRRHPLEHELDADPERADAVARRAPRISAFCACTLPLRRMPAVSITHRRSRKRVGCSTSMLCAPAISRSSASAPPLSSVSPRSSWATRSPRTSADVAVCTLPESDGPGRRRKGVEATAPRWRPASGSGRSRSCGRVGGGVERAEPAAVLGRVQRRLRGSRPRSRSRASRGAPRSAWPSRARASRPAPGGWSPSARRGRRLAVRADALDREIAGAHSIDVEQPTRFLERRWLMLTAGMHLKGSVEAQKALIRELRRQQHQRPRDRGRAGVQEGAARAARGGAEAPASPSSRCR